MPDLAGQVAVVTGASRGIGQAIAIRLGRLGASVVVNYSRDSSGAAATVAAIEAAGSRAVGIRADVRPHVQRQCQRRVLHAAEGRAHGRQRRLDHLHRIQFHAPATARLRSLHVEQAARELPCRNTRPGNRRARGHSQSTQSSRPRQTAQATSPKARPTTRFARSCRTPAPSARAWDRSTISRTQSSSSPASWPAGSADSSCSSVAAHRSDHAPRPRPA
jgi:hypothetical protein